MDAPFAATRSPESVGLCPDRLRRADDLIERFVAEGKIPGAVTLVARDNEIAHLRTHGWQDIENGVPMAPDSLFRIYSMTKIIASTAILALYEHGHLDLNDPVHRYLPGFTGLQVRQPDGSLIPAKRDIRIYDLIRHCAGLEPSPDVDTLRREGRDLAGLAEDWSQKPLIAQPGERWIYGISTDLLARIVEVVSGLPFDQFLRENLFTPLGMTDTAYFADDERAGRLCVCYRHGRDGRLTVQDGNEAGSLYRTPPRLLGGGAGLVSSTADYYRFAAMLLNRGEWNGARILGRKTVELMTLDHLPPEHPHLEIGTQCFRFGLGVSVVTDVAQSRCLSSLGDFGWGGAAGTQVWMNPEERMVVMIMIQVRAEVPTGIMDIYKRLVYQALVD